MFVHPISLSITEASTDQLRVQVRYEIESNDWDIDSQQIFTHRCTLESASIVGHATRPVIAELPVEPSLLMGQPERFVVDFDKYFDRAELTRGDGTAVTAFDPDKVRAWVYVFQPIASEPVALGSFDRSAGSLAASGS